VTFPRSLSLCRLLRVNIGILNAQLKAAFVPSLTFPNPDHESLLSSRRLGHIFLAAQLIPDCTATLTATMTLSSLLRITPRLAPTVTRRATRAASSVTGKPQTTKSLDSILIASRGEIVLYVFRSLWAKKAFSDLFN
jgi:hypothetical protein